MILETENLVLSYGRKRIIDSVNIEIEKGEIVTLIGANGSGKSTILKALSRNLKPREGSIYLNGQPLSRMKNSEVARQLVILPQSPTVPPDFTVRDIVSFGRFPHQNWACRVTVEDNKVIDWALEVTGIGELEKRQVAGLSGGERQRAWIAMALAQEPEILLLDEPTTYLDISYQFQVLELIRGLNHKLGITVLMVLHDLNQAARYSDRIIVLKDGRILTGGEPDKVIVDKTVEEVFQIKTRIIYDEIHNCPYIIPVGSSRGTEPLESKELPLV